MNRIYTLIIVAVITMSGFAQAPQKMTYQAVVRDISNNLLVNQPVGVRISILQGNTTGDIVYKELFNPNPITNQNGLVTIEIGTGISIFGDFSGIDWSFGPYYIKTEIDPNGATNYNITGVSQLLSVPYALYAKTAESIIGGIDENDPIYSAWDKSTGISITESQISNLQHIDSIGIANLGYVAGAQENTHLSEIEVDNYVANNGFLTEEIDADSTNEIQSLSVSITGDTLYLLNANYIIIPGISNANNNITYPSDTVITFDNYPSVATVWFGGDDRASYGPRNMVYGQSVKFPFNLEVDYFAVPFTGNFDYVENHEGVGHEVDVRLLVKDINGTEMGAKTFTIPSTFNGGWYSFSISELNIELISNNTYVFMLYVVDGYTNGLKNGIKFDSNGTYINGKQFRTNSSDATNSYIENWDNWSETSYPDLHFRIAGSIVD